MDEMTNAMLAQIQEVERKDERQVLAELAGETIEEYIYETEVWNPKTKRRDRKVRLSWVGVREVARSKGNIVLADPIISETDDHLRIVVKATDLTRNFTVFGGCHQPKKMKVNDVDKTSGEITGFHLEDDPYYFTKGLSKAQRNAMNPCIPADYAVKMIDRFLRAAGKPPLLADPRVKQQKPASKAPPEKPKQPSKSETKPNEQWEKISKADVPDYSKLEIVIWNLCKLQPKEMYAQLGGSSRSDMVQSSWDAFLTLKALYASPPPQT